MRRIAAAALVMIFAACAAAKPKDQNQDSYPASASDGAAVYSTNCSSCHQTDGRGVPGAFPPLAENPIVTGDAGRLIRVVKFGTSGPVAVNGRRYDGVMPGWDANLSRSDLASVITYLRAAWGNKAGAVSATDVAAIKP